MSKLLKETIMRLRLDPSAKFPRELEEHREKNKTAMDRILAYRADREKVLAPPQDQDYDDIEEEPQHD